MVQHSGCRNSRSTNATGDSNVHCYARAHDGLCRLAPGPYCWNNCTDFIEENVGHWRVWIVVLLNLPSKILKSFSFTSIYTPTGYGHSIRLSDCHCSSSAFLLLSLSLFVSFLSVLLSSVFVVVHPIVVKLLGFVFFVFVFPFSLVCCHRCVHLRCDSVVDICGHGFWIFHCGFIASALVAYVTIMIRYSLLLLSPFSFDFLGQCVVSSDKFV